MNSGITLIETVVYLALFSLVIVMIFPITWFISDSRNQIAQAEDLFREATFVQDKIDFYISSANQVILPAENATSSNLIVEDSANYLTKFFILNDVFYIEKNSGESKQLNDQKVKFIDVIFEHKKIPNSFISIITMRLAASRNDFGTTTYVISP